MRWSLLAILAAACAHRPPPPPVAAARCEHQTIDALLPPRTPDAHAWPATLRAVVVTAATPWGAVDVDSNGPVAGRAPATMGDDLYRIGSDLGIDALRLIAPGTARGWDMASALIDYPDGLAGPIHLVDVTLADDRDDLVVRSLRIVDGRGYPRLAPLMDDARARWDRTLADADAEIAAARTAALRAVDLEPTAVPTGAPGASATVYWDNAAQQLVIAWQWHRRDGFGPSMVARRAPPELFAIPPPAPSLTLHLRHGLRLAYDARGHLVEVRRFAAHAEAYASWRPFIGTAPPAPTCRAVAEP